MAGLVGKLHEIADISPTFHLWWTFLVGRNFQLQKTGIQYHGNPVCGWISNTLCVKSLNAPEPRKKTLLLSILVVD